VRYVVIILLRHGLMYCPLAHGLPSPVVLAHERGRVQSGSVKMPPCEAGRLVDPARCLPRGRRRRLDHAALLHAQAARARRLASPAGARPRRG